MYLYVRGWISLRDGFRCQYCNRGRVRLNLHHGIYFFGRLTHQEHGTIPLPAGEYAADRVREYDHYAEEARRVAD